MTRGAGALHPSMALWAADPWAPRCCLSTLSLFYSQSSQGLSPASLVSQVHVAINESTLLLQWLLRLDVPVSSASFPSSLSVSPPLLLVLTPTGGGAGWPTPAHWNNQQSLCLNHSHLEHLSACSPICVHAFLHLLPVMPRRLSMCLTDRPANPLQPTSTGKQYVLQP